MRYADIVLPVPLPKLFTYEVPNEYHGTLAAGQRVVVSFGKKKLLSGIIFSLHNNKPEAYETKPIISILDDKPIVTLSQLKVWEWMADYYQCTLGEVYKAALPSGLKLESETRIFYNDEFEAETEMPEKTQQILDFLAAKKYSTISEINQFSGLKSCHHIIKQLIELDAVVVNEQLKGSWRPKTEVFLSLHNNVRNENSLRDAFDSLSRAPKQLEVLMLFLQSTGGVSEAMTGKEVLKKELASKAVNSSTAINELIKKEMLVQVKRNVDRLLTSKIENVQKVKTLSPEQDSALQETLKGFDENLPVLLHGVTSSGKTEIYIHLIDQAIKKGQQALYLLPEIALTTQITNRLKAHFGEKLGIYHSKFSDDQRVEVYNNLLNNKSYRVILGVRSSVFLPFSNLGLIIIDEEHENSFKQFDPAPRYHARDVALVLGQGFKSSVLLGTATPSIESYYNVQNNKYRLVELTTRFEGMMMPEIIVVNTREAQRKKMMQSHFSPQLLEHISEALSNKQQVILFQNRRGFAPFMECMSCGWIPKCKHCDVSLTYHKHIHQLICHYCGYSSNVHATCQACESPTLNLKGFGTQKIEEEIGQIFPDASIARMDYDTTRSRKGYENIISGFEQGEYNILVGTQMVTKGLDFDRVSLVGILNADQMLNHPDFRAFEKSFQMMAQVSGRAGRKHKRGTVIIQTSDPEHPVIAKVRSNNYAAFYQEQIEEREQFNYPPFYRIIHLTIKHKNQNVTNQAANYLAGLLRSVFGSRILGPQVPPVNRIQDHHLQRIMIKYERKASPSQVKKLIRDCINQTLANERWKYVQIVNDVDPL
ncbi:replication restart helicase PriA [Alkalitalea saponilacus]|uniref:Replication restart protein PriA n=2 Tax=Alkalitalea saponilacus TaxID=889453 RepID=A0A1T5HTB8_9BACT|nr:primosomal protein N' [Alkalitalea saponilacus]ASB51092.1 primosomal protein N' [Alkalitalea saponilacus]SKC23914.1 replication restart DNA helicase PriA [Alkalitalea saponilacus]